MSHSQIADGSDQRHPKNAGTILSESPRQFAQGGNGVCTVAQSENAPLPGFELQHPSAADSLVMLQLASFEGRAS